MHLARVAYMDDDGGGDHHSSDVLITSCAHSEEGQKQVAAFEHCADHLGWYVPAYTLARLLPILF